ncbi:uncharacterized protein STEHIDRAFT_116473 [Stereum hirsutum FP-91666 SS1]|uniref:Uncharacterized protein n=1 Tax=Stereum hirsutum (strain FP-91666) TaxID=721885 RepID=R7RXI2_STEHR|nr:uncharacterized protein STEHIDRAFT_116473 [Stereum hirsutum FP-91666 SS1]EIM79585.1 hypothetical protein STEHIDRAFT_116473 [Stereum hirsutum FP-91666 SS1]
MNNLPLGPYPPGPSQYQLPAYGMQLQPPTMASYQHTPSLHSMNSPYSTPGPNGPPSISSSPEPFSTSSTLAEDQQTQATSTSLGTSIVNQTASTDSTTDEEHLVISTLYVDNLAKSFSLDNPFRNHLQDFVRLASLPDQFGNQLSKADVATRLYTLAVVLGDILERKRQAEANQQGFANVKALYADLQRRLESTFNFNDEQSKNLRKLAKDLIFEAERASVKTLNHDVNRYAKANSGDMQLDNVYGVPSRETALSSHIRRICSSVRNAFRVDLQQSLFSRDPKNQRNLAGFTYYMAERYKRGGATEGLDLKYTLRIALMRRFAMEHADLLNISESDSSNPGDGEPSRKRARGGGKVPEAKDFWAQFDKWYGAKLAAWGSDLTSSSWKEYIDETIARDNSLYDPETKAKLAAQSSASSSSGFNGAGSRNILTGL